MRRGRAKRGGRSADKGGTNLALFNQAKAAIAKAATVSEAKILRDNAEALRAYAKTACDATQMAQQVACKKLGPSIASASYRPGAFDRANRRPGVRSRADADRVGRRSCGFLRNPLRVSERP